MRRNTSGEPRDPVSRTAGWIWGLGESERASNFSVSPEALQYEVNLLEHATGPMLDRGGPPGETSFREPFHYNGWLLVFPPTQVKLE